MKKVHEKKLDVVEMRMLMWMCGVTKLNKTRCAGIRAGGVTKVQEKRLRWFG